jgi:hypothetical protein
LRAGEEEGSQFSSNFTFQIYPGPRGAPTILSVAKRPRQGEKYQPFLLLQGDQDKKSVAKRPRQREATTNLFVARRPKNRGAPTILVVAKMPRHREAPTIVQGGSLNRGKIVPRPLPPRVGGCGGRK